MRLSRHARDRDRQHSRCPDHLHRNARADSKRRSHRTLGDDLQVAYAGIGVAPTLNLAVILGVTADPEPQDPIAVPNAKRPVTNADPHGIDVFLAFHFLEVETRVGGIVSENAVGPNRLLPNCGGQISELLPKLAGGPGLDQSKSSRG